VFDAEFRDEVATIMKRNPNPVAKALGVVPVQHRTHVAVSGGAS
jgi:hypothetical protein